MKVTLLVLLFVCGTLALAQEGKPKKSKRPPRTPDGSTVLQDNWSKRREELIDQLKQAHEAARKSNDAELRKRANTLSGAVNSLIAGLKVSKGRGNLEAEVNSLIEQLKPSANEPNEKNDQELILKRAELTKSVDDAISRAESAVTGSQRPDLKLRFERLRQEGSNLKTTIAAANSAAAVDQAKEQLNVLEEESADVVKEATSWGISLGGILGAAGLCTGMISIILLILTTLHFKNRLNDADIRESKSVDQLAGKYTEIRELLSSIELSNSRLQSDLGNQIAAAQRSSEEAKRLASSSQDRLPTITPDVSENVASTEIESRPTFPSLVSEYLSRIGDSLKNAVEADFITNTLVQTSTQAAPFMLIAEQEAAAGYVLPKPRLQRGQDFSQFYKSYYDCAEPSAGEVYIVRPARVERVGNRWRLQEMGKMEIH